MKLETGLILHVALGVVHTYPGIFEPATLSFRIQKFFAYTWRIQIEFACPHASDGIRIHCRETRPARCAILAYCSVRDWTPADLLRHRIRKYPDYTLSDSLRIYFLRREKIADSKISECVR